MKRFFAVIFLCSAAALQGCKSSGGASEAGPTLPQTAAASDETIPNEVLATVRGEDITLRQLEPVLIDSYGLDVLLMYVQLDLVKQEAARQEVVVTPQDIKDETNITLDELKRAARQMGDTGATTSPDDLSPEETQQLLDQVLQQQHVTRSEFAIIMEINAYLRKIAKPQVISKISEAAVHAQFDATYGAKLVVRYIECANMQQVAAVRRDLAAGKSFQDVARQRNLDRLSAANGGELPPFTLLDNRFPDDFKNLANSLKKGEVSDPMQIGNYFYIVKLIDRLPPAHAKFEDYEQAVRQDLIQKTIQASVTALRKRLGQMALDSMDIQDPVLRKQWDDRLAKKEGELHDTQDIRRELDREHEAATRETLTGPETEPATTPITSAPAAVMRPTAAIPSAAPVPSASRSAEPPATRPAPRAR